MGALAEFISEYSPASREKIDFAWNGKHAAEFKDSNQEFRSQVVRECLTQPTHATPLLLEHLFLAEAEWAAEAWGSPKYFAELGALLLERGKEATLDSFAKGFVRSFDTFGACHEMQLSESLLRRLDASVKESLSQATEENNRKRLEAVLELFVKLENHTATQGWAKLKPGTEISNISIVWPRWYHKLWSKVLNLWRH